MKEGSHLDGFLLEELKNGNQRAFPPFAQARDMPMKVAYGFL